MTVASEARGVRHFRADIEGLRGVAIALVVAYHAGVPGFSGGYVGWTSSSSFPGT